MAVTSVYPVLMSRDVATAATFYRTALGFETTFETDWYVSLKAGEFELAILAHEHGTVPEGYGTPPSGVIVNVEVDDVDAVHERLTTEFGLDPVLSLRSESFGQRHFIVAAPDGVLVDVIEPIAPDADFAQAYTGA
ncbi:glyoxalase [Rhodococcus rhodnii]|uniref:VOC domain-containing protein n=2 Tax=Rhodococcus rhodnii TaxID=38312 RepID=R7WL71_9NOCA|nr:VOC family protein [Rhodococcus rhodnii]EOM76066.1 hypothetical protein Rrhod_2593 [Rhodococcus rhodnii LMG 5362]TXG91463.1 glyoxalase [Rhodococcus rhodnii]